MVNSSSSSFMRLKKKGKTILTSKKKISDIRKYKRFFEFKKWFSNNIKNSIFWCKKWFCDIKNFLFFDTGIKKSTLFLDIKISRLWYQKVIFCYQEFEFMILKNDYLILENNFFFILRIIFWYQKLFFNIINDMTIIASEKCFFSIKLIF